MTGIFHPLAFRNGAQAKNRILLAPLTNTQSHADGTLSDAELHWLRLRAQGGFGTIISCAAHVAKDGQGWPGELGIHDESHLPGLRRLADAMFESGALPMVQIFHGGLRADSSASGTQPWSASDGRLVGEHSKARGATEQDIRNLITCFAAAAQRACEAGMAGVEIHGAHGYLLTQFLSRVENQRTDEWGGPLENRARLMREVVRAVRAAVPEEFVVGIRLSPEDAGNARGLDLDENLQLAGWLCEDGIDFLHLSLWDYRRNTTRYPERHALGLFRSALTDEVRLIAAGNIWTTAEAQEVLALGADGVALGRAAILNPDWPRRAAAPAWEPLRLPVTAAQLADRGCSPVFVDYLRKRPNFVSG